MIKQTGPSLSEVQGVAKRPRHITGGVVILGDLRSRPQAWCLVYRKANGSERGQHVARVADGELDHRRSLSCRFCFIPVDEGSIVYRKQQHLVRIT